MRQSAIVLAILAFTAELSAERIVSSDSSANDSAIVDGYYDFDTGKFYVDTSILGGTWSGYQFLATPGLNLDCDSFSDFFDSAWSHCKTTDQSVRNQSRVSDYLFLDSVPTGIYSLGSVLPSNLSEEDYHDFFAAADVFGSFEEHPENNVFRLRLNYTTPPADPINDDRQVHEYDFAENVAAVYNYITGEVQIQSDGDFSAYSIRLNEPAFIPNEFTSILTGTTDISNLTNQVLSEFARRPMREGTYSVGNILPTGLDLQSIDSLIGRATYSTALSNGDISVTGGEALAISVIPEPGFSTHLAWVALISLVGRPRRKWRLTTTIPLESSRRSAKCY